MAAERQQEGGGGASRAESWDERYGRGEDAWFFGREPSALARQTVHFWRICHDAEPARVLDLGCGEGRDAVYFARQGFAVTAVDLSAVGVRKTERLARESGVTLAGLHCGDIRDYALTPDYDLLFVGNSLSGLGYACLLYMAQMRKATPVGGLNAVRVMTREAGAQVDQPDLYRFDRNELKIEYRGWRLLYYGEDLLWVPHAAAYHSFADIIAQKR
jgi:tellurite methyltransferase